MKSAQEIIDEDISSVIQTLGGEVRRLSGKTVLLTGPAGVLAGYLVDTVAQLNDKRLLEKPCRLVGLSRSEIAPDSRLGHLLGRKDIVFVKHDVVNPYLPQEKVDFIIHAAGRSAPATFQSDPLGTIDVNVNGLRWILDYAKDNAVESVLYMSSGEIYGNPPKEFIPTPETYNGDVSPLGPRACYTESKRLCETLSSIYARLYNVPVKIARPFIVYGPGITVSDRRVIADFMRSCIEGKPIEMLGSGSDIRSYCYIGDATVAFWKLLFSDRNAEPFNVGSDKEEITIKELAEIIHGLFGIPVPVRIRDAKKEDATFVREAPNRVCPDISKIRSTFGFKPKVGIRDGLRRMIDWNLLRLGKSPLNR
jgi:UDP-glucuronate decarboxylase